MLIVPSLMQQPQYSEVTANITTTTTTNNDNVINNNNNSNSNSQKKRRLLFLDRIALVSEKLLRFDNASMLYDSEDDGGEDEDAITAQSDLTLPNRHIHVVTTAALPWMTGTSVNPLLRAAYLCKMTKHINSAAAATNDNNNTISTKTSTCPEQQYVTLVLPWLELPQDRRELYPTNLQFDSPEDQELYIRNWMREQDGLQEEADPNTGIRILFYPARYHSGLRSIFAMGDVCKLILTNDGKDPEQDMGDVAILEEAEHVGYFYSLDFLSLIHYVCVCVCR
jgi:digalactosyldiacylglycerol synthase